MPVPACFARNFVLPHYMHRLPAWLPHGLGVAYLLTCYAPLIGRFILGMHYAAHRRPIRKGSPLAWVNELPTRFLCAFFGMQPGDLN